MQKWHTCTQAFIYACIQRKSTDIREKKRECPWHYSKDNKQNQESFKIIRPHVSSLAKQLLYRLFVS